MVPEQRPPLRPDANFVLPQYKLVYVSTPKAACTTIKWMLADLQGAKSKRFYKSLTGETSRSTTVHQGRRFFPKTPRLRQLSDEKLAEITPENGWMVFTMTRHPAARLWSAWQSKFLLKEPRFATPFRNEDWMPRDPESTEQVIEDWHRFVNAVSSNPRTKIMQDVHFRSQSELLNIGGTPYDKVYDTSQFKVMIKELEEHLRGQGWSGELGMRRSNETPLPAIAPAFPDDIVEKIAKLYREDFEKLDYDDPRPPKLRPDESFSSDLLSATAIIVERGERIGDLSRRARLLAEELKQCREAGPEAAPPVPEAAQPPEQPQQTWQIGPVSVSVRKQQR